MGLLEQDQKKNIRKARKALNHNKNVELFLYNKKYKIKALSIFNKLFFVSALIDAGNFTYYQAFSFDTFNKKLQILIKD
jgi:hypothetical protein